MELDVERLVRACGEDGFEGGVTIRAQLEPVAGRFAPVKPAVYAGGLYQLDRRWWGDPAEVVEVVVIDNVPSQANRLEAALQARRAELGLPELVLDLSGVGPLPPHVPTALSSFRFPHRQADAYLRDAWLDGMPLPKSPMGQALLAATADDATALLAWFPQALLFGFWQSHLGKKGSQAKLARSWVSEIAGYRPASTETRVLGLKGDPLNLTAEEPVLFDPDDQTSWELVEGAKKAGGSKKKETLAEIGHGQVPVSAADAALGGVSFQAVEQRATVSLASLRRIHAGSPEASAAARALLVALGIVAHVGAFGRTFSLRSGADLRPVDTTWTWLGTGSDEELVVPSWDDAASLFRGCVARAEAAGLPVGSQWPADPVQLVPSPELVKVIRSTYPSPEPV